MEAPGETLAPSAPNANATTSTDALVDALAAGARPSKEAILDLVQCCVCQEVPPLPWDMCSAGSHMICRTCRPKLQAPACPMCRCSTQTMASGRTLYQMLSLFGCLPQAVCRFQGCTTPNLTFETLEAHEAQCGHRAYGCPVDERCNWAGTRGAVEMHLVNQHNTRRVERGEEVDIGPAAPGHNNFICDGILFVTGNRTEGGGQLTGQWLYAYTFGQEHLPVQLTARCPGRAYRATIVHEASPLHLTDNGRRFEWNRMSHQQTTCYLAFPPRARITVAKMTSADDPIDLDAAAAAARGVKRLRDDTDDTLPLLPPPSPKRAKRVKTPEQRKAEYERRREREAKRRAEAAATRYAAMSEAERMSI